MLTKSPFGKTKEGVKVDKYTLRNKNSMEVSVINLGGIITSIKAADRDSVFEDVVLGFDSLSGYENEHPYFGALIGRFGNRIANGKFLMDGKEYSLATNNGENHLHGGLKGFDKVIWDIEEHTTENGAALKLSYMSKDMEEGYPGNLKLEVIYTLTDQNELIVDYRATTDQKTVLNLTQHSYFNLSGNPLETILDHELMIAAGHFLPVTQTLIPTGEFRDVSGTPFDFRKPERIGSRIDADNEQLKFGLGYDHCWVLSDSDSLRLAASLYHPPSGRQLDVLTTEPGIQFYSGNFLDGTLTGKSGTVYNHRSGLCLETQHFPDSPNQKNFPSVELNPGEVYQSKTVFRFTTK